MQVSRRQLMIGSLPAVLAGKSLFLTLTSQPDPASLRVAHLTDFHLRADTRTHRGIEAALRVARDRGAQVLLLGGDLIEGGMGMERSTVQERYRELSAVLEDHRDLPILASVGNHDIWGWSVDGANPDDAIFGKALFGELFEQPEPFFSRSFASWRIIVLDSLMPGSDRPYVCGLGEPQMEWLKNELATASEAHVFILSHVPIYTITAIIPERTESEAGWVIRPDRMHFDARAIHEAFVNAGNVRIAVAGHTHLFDELQYGGMVYASNGAVCGRWWNGDHEQTPAGFSLFDLKSDGSFDREYVAVPYEV